MERLLALIPGSRAGAFKEAQPALGGQGEAGAILHLVLLLSSFLPRLLSTLGAVASPGSMPLALGPPAPLQPHPGPTRAGSLTSCCWASRTCPRCAPCSLLTLTLTLTAFLLTLLGNTLIALLTALDPALRTPRYFFLRQLALVEICFSLDIVPWLLVTLMWPGRGVSPAGCALQLLLVLSCVTSECFLLTATAGDRYVAICWPLHYGAIVSPRLCHVLAATCWLAGVPVSLVFTIWLLRFPFCGPRGVRHFFCDVAPLLSLVCEDTRVFEASVLAATVLVIMVPFCLIATSYTGVLATVLRMPSATGRHEALSTCAPHLW